MHIRVCADVIIYLFEPRNEQNTCDSGFIVGLPSAGGGQPGQPSRTGDADATAVVGASETLRRRRQTVRYTIQYLCREMVRDSATMRVSMRKKNAVEQCIRGSYDV